MRESISTLGYQVINQIISAFQLVCVIDLLLERKHISWKRGIGYLVGLIFTDIIMTIYKSGSNYYIWIVIMMIFILYKGKLVHRILAMCVSISIICVAELLGMTVLGYMIKGALEVGMWEELFLRVGHLILVVVGIIIFKSIGVLSNKKREFEDLPRRDIFVLSGLSLLSIAIFGGGILIYDGAMIATHNPKFLFILVVGIFVLDLSLLVIVDKNIHTRYYKKVKDLTEKQLTTQINYYAKLEKVTKETQALKHDMTNHMICMKGLLELGEINELREYIQSIENRIKVNTKVVRTGNTIVDAILNEKYSIARDKEVNIEIDVVLPSDIRIDMMDLCTIISNGIDNAIEACEKIALIEKREIQIVGRYTQGYFIFDITNKTSGHVEVVNNTVKTIKKDSENHGYGLRNIKNSVDKYKGKLNLSHKENAFKLEILINTHI